MIPLAQQLAEINNYRESAGLKNHQSVVTQGFSDVATENVFSCITDKPQEIDALSRKSGYSPHTVRKICRHLCLGGRIENIGKGKGLAGRYLYILKGQT